jgi:CheY-like chemotaxis protein
MPTVLLVEDDSGIRGLVAELLQGEGYSVLEAEDGAEAIHHLDQQRAAAQLPSAIILDMLLPLVPGVEVLRYLRQQGLSTPVVAVSANREALAQATEAGAQATLAKPFSLNQLLGILERYCP